MPIERHGVDTEFLAELAHAQGLDAAPIGELHRGPKHTLPIQGRAGSVSAPGSQLPLDKCTV